MKQITTIIPVFRNSEMVIRNLKNNLPFLEATDIILIDDASHDGTVEKIREAFPSLQIMQNSVNLGFGKTINRAAKEAKGEFLFLLNSDVVLADTSFAKTISDFMNNPNLFAVCAMQKERDGKNVGRNKIYYKGGLIYHKRIDTLKKGVNGWADGGSSLFRRRMFEDLGGLNELLSPFYFEDIELSYRAHKRGWEILFDPSFHVEHHHESTIGKYYTKQQIARIALKNQIVASWSVFTSPIFILKSIFWIKWNFIKALLRMDRVYIRGYIDAVATIPSIITYQAKNADTYKLSDSQVFSGTK